MGTTCRRWSRGVLDRGWPSPAARHREGHGPGQDAEPSRAGDGCDRRGGPAAWRLSAGAPPGATRGERACGGAGPAQPGWVLIVDGPRRGQHGSFRRRLARRCARHGVDRARAVSRCRAGCTLDLEWDARPSRCAWCACANRRTGCAFLGSRRGKASKDLRASFGVADDVRQRLRFARDQPLWRATLALDACRSAEVMRRRLLIGSRSNRAKRMTCHARSRGPSLIDRGLQRGPSPRRCIGLLHRLLLPFEDARLDEIHADEVLEHVGAPGDWRTFFAQFVELWTNPQAVRSAAGGLPFPPFPLGPRPPHPHTRTAITRTSSSSLHRGIGTARPHLDVTTSGSSSRPTSTCSCKPQTRTPSCSSSELSSPHG